MFSLPAHVFGKVNLLNFPHCLSNHSKSLVARKKAVPWSWKFVYYFVEAEFTSTKI